MKNCLRKKVTGGRSPWEHIVKSKEQKIVNIDRYITDILDIGQYRYDNAKR